MNRILLILLLFCLPASATNYFVDNGGNDSNSGLSSGSAWQHVAHALVTAPSGSTIYLTSGQTFSEDNLYVAGVNNLVIAGGGTSPAIIQNVTIGTNQFSDLTNYILSTFTQLPCGRDVFAISNASSITLSNLSFHGFGNSAISNFACIDIFSDFGYCTNIVIQNCDCTNALYGISPFSIFITPNDMFQGLMISNTAVHEIAFDGVLEWSKFSDQTGSIYGSNIVTCNLNIYNVHGITNYNSGTGIAMFNVSHWECFSNYVHDCGDGQGTGGNGGAGGIFPVYFSDHVHIWNNHVARVWAKPTGDGVGIDLDEGTRDSVVEGNFIHDCGGAGYYSFLAYSNNIWRWNVGINDGNGMSPPGLPSPGQAPEMWFNDGTIIKSNAYMYVYNNTLIGNYEAFQTTDNEGITNFAVIANNIFGQINKTTALINQANPFNNNPNLGTNWYFTGNCYLVTNNNFLISWPSSVNNFTTLGDWRVFGQEAGTGNTNNPLFVVGSGSVAANYLLSPSSSLVGAGIDVTTYGVSAGTMDYLGNPVQANHNNIGGLANNIFNVLTYGALGDETNITATCTTNSASITTSVALPVSRIGEAVQIYAGGVWGTSPGTNQDLAAFISNISGTTVTLDRVAGHTASGLICRIGTNNAAPFNACLAAAGNGGIVYIPNGRYMIMGAEVFTNWSMPNPYQSYPAIPITNQNVIIEGQSTAGTILIGNGAWQNKGLYAYRGHMFQFVGPQLQPSSITIETLTSDGANINGFDGMVGQFPASTGNGLGWDVTHDFTIDGGGNIPWYANVNLISLMVTNWEGEQCKSIQSIWDTAYFISGCTFCNGDATGLGSWVGSSDVVNCTFNQLAEAMEFYQGYYSNTFTFESCVVTNTLDIMAVNGAVTNHVVPPMIVKNNSFSDWQANGIQTTPANNLTISNNTFGAYAFSLFPLTIGVIGYQGNAMNSNILFVCNLITNCWSTVELEGSGANSTLSLLVSNNTAYGVNTPYFAESESAGWGTNMVFVQNWTTNFSAGLNSVGMTGQYFRDDDSNHFPHYLLTAVSGTNEAGYEHGENVDIQTSVGNASVFLDNGKPSKIPADVHLNITNISAHSVVIYTSTNTTSGPFLTLLAGTGTTVGWDAQSAEWGGNCLNITALSANYADVQTAVSNCCQGGTVHVPAGNVGWPTEVIVPTDINLIGAGIGKTIITNNTGGTMLYCICNSNFFPSISGFSFRHGNEPAQAGTSFEVAGTSHAWHMSFCEFDFFLNYSLQLNGWIEGCIDHCTFYLTNFTAIEQEMEGYGNQQFGDGSWSDGENLGTTNYLYLENDTFIAPAGFEPGMLDGYYGPRTVIRYCISTNCPIGSHGTDNGGRGRGFKQKEVYNNTFFFNTNNGATWNQAVYDRSGFTLFYSNYVHGYQYEINMQPYRAGAAAFLWFFQAATGTNWWDSNNPTIFYTGNATGPDNSAIYTDSGASFPTPNGYTSISNYFMLWDKRQQQAAEISANTTTTITFNGTYNGFLPGSMIMSNNDLCSVRQVYYILDMPGMWHGDLLTNNNGAPYNATLGGLIWPRETLGQTWEWANTISGQVGGFPSGFISGTAGTYQLATPLPGYQPLPYPHPLDTATNPTPPVVIPVYTPFVLGFVPPPPPASNNTLVVYSTTGTRNDSFWAGIEFTSLTTNITAVNLGRYCPTVTSEPHPVLLLSTSGIIASNTLPAGATANATQWVSINPTVLTANSTYAIVIEEDGTDAWDDRAGATISGSTFWEGAFSPSQPHSTADLLTAFPAYGYDGANLQFQ